MDPNAALLALLRGHEPGDHTEALCAWIAGGGFLPEIALDKPIETHAILAISQAVRVAADERGVWASMHARGFDWHLVAEWADLVEAFCEPEDVACV